VSNLHGPWLVDVVASFVSLAALAGFLKVWKPKKIWRLETGVSSQESDSLEQQSAVRNSQSAIDSPKSKMFAAWLPWIILSLVVFVWGLPQTKALLDGIAAPKIPIYGLDKLISRVPPVVAKPTPEAAVFNFNFLSAAGSAIFIAAIIAGFVMRYSFMGMLRVYWQTLKIV